MAVVDNNITFACQTYSWQMSGSRYRGQLDRIAAVAAEAGFKGLEPEVFMLGGDYREAARLRAVLDRYGLQLASIALACEWRHQRETDEERAEADVIIGLLTSFPGAKLILVQLPGPDRADLRIRQENAVNCINAVGRRAVAAGVEPSVHPNSPPGSVFRESSDYEILLDKVDASIGFTPDLGHIAAGGMDPLDIVSRYRSRVNHIHFKDIDSSGTWVPTGNGNIDFRSVVALLAKTGYRGWIVLEDESESARLAPDDAARRNGRYVEAVLAPLVWGGVGDDLAR